MFSLERPADRRPMLLQYRIVEAGTPVILLISPMLYSFLDLPRGRFLIKRCRICSQTLKLSSFAENEKYSIGLLRREILRFQTEDTEKLAAVINGIEKYLYHKNRQQIKSISALYRLCEQVESNKFEIW